jgi:hypothetical protein
MVLETKTKTSIMDKHTYEKQIVGGSIENINSIHKHLKHQFSHATEHENHIDHDIGKDANEINGSSMSAGSISAGGLSNHTDYKRRIHRFAK